MSAHSIERLRERPEFLRVASTRFSHATPGLILQMREHNHQERSDNQINSIRLGFTVSKKVGNAVVRNRVKRRLRAAADIVLPSHARRHRDFVIIGRKNTFKRSFADLITDLEKALKKLNAYEVAA